MTDSFIQQAEEAFQKALSHLKTEFAKLQIGRANAALVEDIFVEAYGTKQPLKTLASVSIPESRTLQIQPWDKSILSAVEKAIVAANLGINPVNDGRLIRISMPPLTEERRVELVKVVSRMAEDCRIVIRQARGDAHAAFRKLQHEKKISEDEQRLAEKKLQEKVDHTNKEAEELAKKKEQDILTI